MGTILSTIRMGVLCVVIGLWIPIGLFFWIPLLVRATAVFAVGVLYSLLVSQPREYCERLRVPLDIAMGFYVEGFQRVLHTLYPEELISIGNGGDGKTLQQIKVPLDRFIGELVWTAIFWFTTLLGYAQLVRGVF